MKKLSNRAAGLMATFGVVAFCCGCATLASPTSVQRVAVSSEPSGAQLLVDGRPQGVTPVDVELNRRNRRTRICLEKDGFGPEELVVERRLSRWLLADTAYAVFAGVVSPADGPPNSRIARVAGALATVLGLEYLTGAAFRLPDEVAVEMESVEGGASRCGRAGG